MMCHLSQYTRTIPEQSKTKYQVKEICSSHRRCSPSKQNFGQFGAKEFCACFELGRQIVDSIF
jgi:hypothetical protein